MKQQINTFEEIFNRRDKNGVYLYEDLHTSYWPDWGGDYRKKSTFIKYSNHFIDYINAWHSKTSRLSVTEFTKSVHSLYFYDSVLVIEKQSIEKPFHLTIGIPTIPDFHPRESLLKRINKRLKRKIGLLTKLFT